MGIQGFKTFPKIWVVGNQTLRFDILVYSIQLLRKFAKKGVTNYFSKGWVTVITLDNEAVNSTPP